MSTIDIRQIKIRSNRKRRINNDKVNELRDSINSIGLINPITLDKDNYLIAGHHRYQALLSLGKKDVPFTVLETDDALLIELAEIDENFVRYELTEIELGEHLKARKEIYEKLFPQTKNGMRNGQTSKKTDSVFLEKKSFVDDTSEKLNKSQTVIKDSIKIAKDISPEVKEMIYNTPLADQKTNLLELSRLEPEKQKQVVEAIKDNPKADVKEHLKQEKREAKLKEIKAKAESSPIPTNIKLLEGDLFDVINQVPDDSIDLLNTDPPYNMAKEYWDKFTDKEFKEFTIKWINAILPKLKKDYMMFISINSDNLYLYEKIFKDLNLEVKSRLIWHYRNAGGKSAGKFMFSKTYEVVFHVGNKELNFDDEWTDERFDVWTLAIPQSNFTDGKYHVTQKPLDLYRKLIKLGSNYGDTVLDCFGGSGTSAIVSKELNRDCIIIEKDKDNATIIKGRIADV